MVATTEEMAGTKNIAAGVDREIYAPNQRIFEGRTHYAITDHTSLKGGFGSFSQPPEFVESSPAFGNPDLDVTRSLHASAGVDQTVVDGVFLSVEGFYKHMYDRVVGLPGAVAPRFVNEGLGRVYGMEVQGRVDPVSKSVVAGEARVRYR
jgi:outer membrane cobalamin receptor